MIIDGKTIQQQIVKELLPRVQERSRKPMLGIVVVGDDPVSLRYTTMKQACASTLGVVVTVVRHEVTISQEAFLQEVSALCNTVDGIVVQLPLPKHIDQEKVLALIPWHKDVDVLSPQARERYINGTLPIVPPVVGAIIEVLTRYAIPLEGKNVVLVGNGTLVGAPFSVWLKHNNYKFTHVFRDTPDREHVFSHADIIISGTGNQGSIAPEMIKSGAVLIDAGTSEVAGVLVGDFKKECASRAGLMTPVPGGIGPITIAVLFKNLLTLIDASHES